MSCFLARREAGYTLLELIVVVAMIGIMSTVATVSISFRLPDFKLTAATRDMVLNFQRARIEAIKRNSLVSVRFNKTIDSVSYDYVVFVDNNADLDYTVGEEIIAKVDFSDYKFVRLDTTQGGGDGVDFQGASAFAWNRRGLPVKLSKSGVSGTVYLENPRNKTKQVHVSLAGNIRIQQ